MTAAFLISSKFNSRGKHCIRTAGDSDMAAYGSRKLYVAEKGDNVIRPAQIARGNDEYSVGEEKGAHK